MVGWLRIARPDVQAWSAGQAAVVLGWAPLSGVPSEPAPRRATHAVVMLADASTVAFEKDSNWHCLTVSEIAELKE